MKVIMNLDTQYRDSGSSISNPRWTLNQQMQCISRVKVLSATIPCSFYPVDSRNNKVYFTTAGVDYIATLTPGVYSVSTLITELKTRMDAAASATFTITYGSSTGKLTVAIGSGTFMFTFGTNTALSAGPVLGFTTDGTLAASQIGDSVVDLGGPRRIYVICRNLSLNNFNKTQPNCLIAIPNTGSFGASINYQNDEDQEILVVDGSRTSTQYISTLDLQLTSATGYEVNLNGLDWSISLEVDFVPN